MLIIEPIVCVLKYNSKKFTQEYPNKFDKNSKICINTANRKALR